MQHEYRGIWRRFIKLFQRRHTAFSELELAPAAHYAHPLRRRRAIGLIFEHSQRIRQRRHPFPAQLEVVVQSAADQVQVRVIKSWDHRMAVQIDNLCALTGIGHHLRIAADG